MIRPELDPVKVLHMQIGGAVRLVAEPRRVAPDLRGLEDGHVSHAVKDHGRRRRTGNEDGNGGEGSGGESGGLFHL